MELEQIKSTLIGKIGQTSLSDRTVNEYLARVAPKDGVEPDDAFFNLHADILKTLGGQYNHDLANEIENFKKNYNPAPKEPNKPVVKTEPDQNPEMKAILERLAKLEGIQKQEPVENQQMKQLESQINKLLEINSKQTHEQFVSNLVGSLDSKIAENKLVINDKNMWGLAVDMAKSGIKDDTTADKFLEMVKDQYNGLFQRLNPGSESKPYGSSEGGGNGSIVQAMLKKRLEAETKSLEERAKARESWK